MNFAPQESVFKLPLRHLWSAQFSNDLIAQSRPVSGLSNYIGDDANPLLRYFVEIDIPIPTDWPIVFYGPSGTGKTSLGMSILERVLSNDAADREVVSTEPVFIAASDFVRRFRSAIETDSVAEFRERFAGGVFIDNLQYLVGFPTAQQELCFLIDQILDRSRPLIVTVSQSPLDPSVSWNQQFLPQLVSRLQGGLCIPVQPPGASARRALIAELAGIMGISFTEGAIDWLVENLIVTVPKLTHVLAQFKLAHPIETSMEPATPDHLMTWFQKMHEGSELKRIREIAKVVANEFGFTVAELKGQSRKQTLSLARSIAIYLCRELVGVSFLKIGKTFGNRDHSTVMHSCRKIAKLLKSPDRQEARIVSRIKNKLADQFVEIQYQPVENL